MDQHEKNVDVMFKVRAALPENKARRFAGTILHKGDIAGSVELFHVPSLSYPPRNGEDNESILAGFLSEQNAAEVHDAFFGGLTKKLRAKRAGYFVHRITSGRRRYPRERRYTRVLRPLS